MTFSGGADGAVDEVCGGEGEGGGIQKCMCIDCTINFLHGIVKFSLVYLVLVR